MNFSRHHLFGMKGLTREEIETILTTAESLKEISFRDIKKVPTLRGKTVVNFFHEPSTRTRTSFEIAAKRSKRRYGQLVRRTPVPWSKAKR